MRYYVYLFLFMLFGVNLVSLMIIPGAVWSVLEWWQIFLYALSFLTSLCMVLIGYWSWKDSETIERLLSRIAELRSKIDDIEREKKAL